MCYVYDQKGKCLICKESFSEYSGECLDTQEFQEVTTGKKTLESIVSKRLQKKNDSISTPDKQSMTNENFSVIVPTKNDSIS